VPQGNAALEGRKWQMDELEGSESDEARDDGARLSMDTATIRPCRRRGGVRCCFTGIDGHGLPSSNNIRTERGTHHVRDLADPLLPTTLCTYNPTRYIEGIMVHRRKPETLDVGTKA